MWLWVGGEKGLTSYPLTLCPLLPHTRSEFPAWVWWGDQEHLWWCNTVRGLGQVVHCPRCGWATTTWVTISLMIVCSASLIQDRSDCNNTQPPFHNDYSPKGNFSFYKMPHCGMLLQHPHLFSSTRKWHNDRETQSYVFPDRATTWPLPWTSRVWYCISGHALHEEHSLSSLKLTLWNVKDSCTSDLLKHTITQGQLQFFARSFS